MSEKRKLTLSLSLGGAQKKQRSSSIKANPLAKKSAIGEDVEESKPKKQLISHMEEGGIKGQVEEDSKPLVIPLTKNPWEKGGSKYEQATEKAALVPEEKKDSQTTSLEDDAVQSLIAEAKVSQGGVLERKKLVEVIPLAQQASTVPSEEKGGPILQSCKMPGMENITNEDEKFQFDVANRAENIDEKSDCYRAVPIADFGEALLRGMGWDGKKNDDIKDTVARPVRLGLGATPRPPEEKQGLHTKRPGFDKTKGKKEKEEWKRKGEERLKSQKLYVGDIIRLLAREHLDRRARVSKTDGVPGLNSVEVSMEGTGELMVVQKKLMIPVESHELEDKPFVDGKPVSLVPPAAKDAGRPSSSKFKWASLGIRVRVIAEGKYFRLKGEVMEIDDDCIFVDLDEGKTIRIRSEKDLETLIPAVGKRVRVVRGEFKGRTLEVLDKDRDREEIKVKVDGKKKYLFYDEVTEVGKK